MTFQDNESESLKHDNLAEALYAIREEVGPLTRDAENPHFTSKFTSLPSLVEKVDPIAWKHGVLLHHQISGERLIHELWFNGASVEEYSIPLPNPQGTAQGLGSALTYMRRYDYTTSLGLVADLDDDGTEASKPAAQPTTRREPPTRPAGPLSEKLAAVVANHPAPAAGELDTEF